MGCPGEPEGTQRLPTPRSRSPATATATSCQATKRWLRTSSTPTLSASRGGASDRTSPLIQRTDLPLGSSGASRTSHVSVGCLSHRDRAGGGDRRGGTPTSALISDRAHRPGSGRQDRAYVGVWRPRSRYEVSDQTRRPGRSRDPSCSCRRDARERVLRRCPQQVRAVRVDAESVRRDRERRVRAGEEPSRAPPGYEAAPRTHAWRGLGLVRSGPTVARPRPRSRPRAGLSTRR